MLSRRRWSRCAVAVACARRWNATAAAATAPTASPSASTPSQWSSSDATAVFQRLNTARLTNPNWASAFAETLSDEQISEGSNPNAKKRKGSAVLSDGKFVVGVSDDIDVAGFSNRFGVNSSLIHTSPAKDHPFVEWLRSRGATVMGKVRLTSPFSLTESINLEACPAADAVISGVCDVAVITSLYGVAGSNAPSRHPVVSFAPSASTFPRGLPPWTKYRSLALTFRDIHSLCSFWDDLTAARGSPTTVSDGTAVDEDDPSAVATPTATKRSAAAVAKLCELWSRCWKPSDAPTARKQDVGGGGIVVGVPEDWIEACYRSTQPGTGRDFLKEVQRIMNVKNLSIDSKKRSSKSARAIEVRELSWSASPDDLIACATAIVHYELAYALKQAHMDGTGLLDQLPAAVVSSIFEGKNMSEAVYRDALSFRSELSREYIDEAAEVDCVMMPTTSPPYVTHNLRTGLVALPIALSRAPSVSMRLSMPRLAEGGIARVAGSANDEVAVMYSSEPGMDSALLDTVYELNRN